MSSTENPIHWMISNELSIDMGSEENAEIFYKSFTPELESMPLKRSEMNIKRNVQHIIIKVKAEDVNAFRANINSVLQFANVVISITNFIEEN